MTPGVRHLCAVDVQPMVDWISAIPFEAWPQQHPRLGVPLRPAMVTDLEWPHEDALGFGRAMSRSGILWELAAALADTRVVPGGAKFINHMLSAVMPGDVITPHSDYADAPAPAGWITRVHVPLLTNPLAEMRFPNDTSRMMTVGRSWNMQVGEAYLVDVRQVHEVLNQGTTPRVHFMFDVLSG